MAASSSRRFVSCESQATSTTIRPTSWIDNQVFPWSDDPGQSTEAGGIRNVDRRSSGNFSGSSRVVPGQPAFCNKPGARLPVVSEERVDVDARAEDAALGAKNE